MSNSSQSETSAADVIQFWLDAGPEAWFKQNDEFDRALTERFGGTYGRAAAGEYSEWADTPQGALALILMFDQFSRNMFRSDPRAFSMDETALALSEKMIERGWDHQIDPKLRSFVYMPFMHSESIVAQTRMLGISHECGGLNLLKYARIHRDIIMRFGRFPHRNKVMGRSMTPAEQAFLDDGGFSA